LRSSCPAAQTEIKRITTEPHFPIPNRLERQRDLLLRNHSHITKRQRPNELGMTLNSNIAVHSSGLACERRRRRGENTPNPHLIQLLGHRKTSRGHSTMRESISGWNSPGGRGYKWPCPQTEGFVSIMVEGTWKTRVYALVVSEGGKKDHGVVGEKGQRTHAHLTPHVQTPHPPILPPNPRSRTCCPS